MTAKEKSRIDVLISIHPFYASKIIEGLKTVELRRKFPELSDTPARMVIYSTHPVKSIIGYAEIDMVHRLSVNEIWKRFSDEAHIERADFNEYFFGLTHGYVVQLINPKKFKTPVPIDYIKENYGMIAPQSYRYLNEEHMSIFDYAGSKSKNHTGYKHPHTDRRQQAR
jgi:predicted transcriptional regulator